MRLLLDAHILLWWLADSRALGRQARDAIASPQSTVYVSAATVWEISIKRTLGKLDAPADLERQLIASRFEPLPITIPNANAAGALPLIHHDPFDRMLVAQAQAEGLTIVTKDSRIPRYGVPTLAI